MVITPTNADVIIHGIELLFVGEFESERTRGSAVGSHRPLLRSAPQFSAEVDR
jgi:hypothetical protein